MSFKKDMNTGKSGEETVIQNLKRMGFPCKKNTAKDRETLAKWDVSFIDGDLEPTIEVKKDIYEKKSGNVAIEYMNCKTNKPSGINATEADIWCFVLHDDSVWFCGTKVLKEYIADLANKPLRIINVAGDGNASILLYNRVKLFEDMFFRVDSASKKEFGNWLGDLL